MPIVQAVLNTGEEVTVIESYQEFSKDEFGNETWGEKYHSVKGEFGMKTVRVGSLRITRIIPTSKKVAYA